MENQGFNKNKLSSGRFFLCLCAGIAIMMLATVVSCVIWSTIGKDDPQVHPIVLTAMTAIISFISGTVGFYFGQHSQKQEPVKE